MDRRRRRRKIAAFSMIMLSWLQWQMGMFAPLCESDDDAVEGDDGYSFQSSGRSSSFIGLTMFQLLGVLLSQPEFANALTLVRRARRFWSAPRGDAVWETQFLRTFRLVGRLYPDWEDDQYVQHFRMRKDAFWRLHRKYGYLLERQVTQFRHPIPTDKRLAITLHFLAQGLSFAQLALMYGVGKSTAVAVVHDTVKHLRAHLVPDSIQFPKGRELEQVLVDFENLRGGGLPLCAGAVDGTFMKVRKPCVYGDSYWCYKHYTGILIPACVDARGVFTYVNAGSPGSRGDAAVFNTSRLYDKIRRRRWLGTDGAVIGGRRTMPYLVGDMAFGLSACLMKCYAEGQDEPHQLTFNHRHVRTRRVVEQAFGRLKGRFRVLIWNNISDPSFAADIAMVCCALHNVCERWSCAFDQSWLIEPEMYKRYHPAPDAHINDDADDPGIAIRQRLSKYIQAKLPVYH